MRANIFFEHNRFESSGFGHLQDITIGPINRLPFELHIVTVYKVRLTWCDQRRGI